MKIRWWECGCHITWSMFGDQEVLDAKPCLAHMILIAGTERLADFVEKLCDLLAKTETADHKPE